MSIIEMCFYVFLPIVVVCFVLGYKKWYNNIVPKSLKKEQEEHCGCWKCFEQIELQYDKRWKCTDDEKPDRDGEYVVCVVNLSGSLIATSMRYYRGRWENGKWKGCSEPIYFQELPKVPASYCTDQSKN